MREGLAADADPAIPTSGPAPTSDVWIAATSARVGSLVLTYDRQLGM